MFIRDFEHTSSQMLYFNKGLKVYFLNVCQFVPWHQTFLDLANKVVLYCNFINKKHKSISEARKQKQ